jgi:hypothetical protein
LGPTLVAPPILPRVSSTAVIVDPHTSLNQFLSAQLGPGVSTVEQHAEATKASSNATITQEVLGNQFIHAVLSRQDTYTLLNSVATTVLGSTAANVVTQQATVTYTVPTQATWTPPLTDPMIVTIKGPTQSQDTYVSVPVSDIQGSSTNGTVTLPLDQVPSGAPLPPTSTVPTGSLTQVFTATGPIILSALKSAVPRSGTNAPHTIPGLRLAGFFNRTPSFPSGHTTLLLYALRVAVDRNVFALSSDQTNQLNAGLSQFESTVATMNNNGVFQPAVPPAAPPLPKGQLYGTLEVSLGALRNLSPAFVNQLQTGLQLTGVGNFPGRFDVGFVFDRYGNFGVELTARGPLLGAPKGVASQNVVAGDIRVEVSNAQSLSALNGLRSVEGLSQGTAMEGGIETATYANGIKTLAASAGYGSGLEFGTGVAYTQVIPLGNVYSLIPASPQQTTP